MKYRVDRAEEAEKGLADAWLAAADRPAVTAAARRVELALGRDPFAVGESRDDFDTRILFDGPLGVYYRVDVPARCAVVVSAGLFGRG